MEKLLRNLTGTLAFGVITVNTIVCFVPLITFAFIKLLVPQSTVRRIMTRWIMGIGGIWVSLNTWIFGVVNDTEWDVRGLEGLSVESWYLVIANHQTWTDIVVLPGQPGLVSDCAFSFQLIDHSPFLVAQCPIAAGKRSSRPWSSSGAARVAVTELSTCPSLSSSTRTTPRPWRPTR